VLRPHDARYTFAFELSQRSGHNRAELDRRLGHANEVSWPVSQVV
jgi:integrase